MYIYFHGIIQSPVAFHTLHSSPTTPFLSSSLHGCTWIWKWRHRQVVVFNQSEDPPALPRHVVAIVVLRQPFAFPLPQMWVCLEVISVYFPLDFPPVPCRLECLVILGATVVCSRECLHVTKLQSPRTPTHPVPQTRRLRILHSCKSKSNQITSYHIRSITQS